MLNTKRREAEHRSGFRTRGLSRPRVTVAQGLIGLAVLVASPMLAPGSASALECSGTCGDIAGTITAPGSDKGNSVVVYVYDSLRNFVKFGGNGVSYEAGPLDPGNYYVCFVPTGEPPEWYLQQCYNGTASGAASLNEASGVGVEASAVTKNINATIAQGGAVTGTVTDAATGKPIILATAAVVGAPPQICANGATNCSVNGLSGEEGEYFTRVIAPGEHTLEFSASGYATKSVAATVTATHTTTLNVALEPATSGGGGTGGSGSGGGTGARAPVAEPAVRAPAAEPAVRAAAAGLRRPRVRQESPVRRLRWALAAAARSPWIALRPGRARALSP